MTYNPDDSEVKQLRALVSELEDLLRQAHCPNCDGCGFYEVEGTSTGIGCCGCYNNDGSCCGNGVAVPVPDLQLEQCEWCHERARLLDDDSLITSTPQGYANIDDEIPF